MSAAGLRIRPLRADDQDVLWDLLHVALWDPPPAPLRPRSVLDDAHVRIYAESWGAPGDVGVVGELEGVPLPIGACWMRALSDGQGLAFVDERTPQLGIAVFPPFQGQGCGSALMVAALDAARAAGYRQIALTVHPENPAIAMYERCGFRKAGMRRSYHLMIAPLQSRAMVAIRPMQQEDWPAVWPILRATFDAGDTYVFAPGSTEADIHKAWVEIPAATYVAVANDATILGTYHIRANQPGLGSHVCNCGYVVAAAAQGQGIATALCEHSQSVAVEMGFRAMQFNIVVSTNERAVRLWKKLGFAIAGTLPGAFHHAVLGYVDAHVMFKTLVPKPGSESTFSK